MWNHLFNLAPSISFLFFCSYFSLFFSFPKATLCFPPSSPSLLTFTLTFPVCSFFKKTKREREKKKMEAWETWKLPFEFMPSLNKDDDDDDSALTACCLPQCLIYDGS